MEISTIAGGGCRTGQWLATERGSSWCIPEALPCGASLRMLRTWRVILFNLVLKIPGTGPRRVSSPDDSHRLAVLLVALHTSVSVLSPI